MPMSFARVGLAGAFCDSTQAASWAKAAVAASRARFGVAEAEARVWLVLGRREC